MKRRSQARLYTIPALARRLGVSAPSVRNWIERAYIDPPDEIPVTNERVYSEEAASSIERWYMQRAANGGTRGPGAVQRRIRAQEWLRKNGKLAPTISAAGQPTPAATVFDEVGRWLELGDDLLPVVPLVAAVANKLPGPPVWLMIVAPPSSGKSEVIMGISGIAGVHKISKVTSKTFASGMMQPAGDGGSPSLLEPLHETKQWLLVLKDFGTIQSLPSLDRNAILGQLREIYDGQFSANYGTGVEVNWSGKLGMLVGATPAVDRQYRWSAELGERFVQFRPSAPDQKRVADRAAAATDQERELREAVVNAYQDGFAAAVQLLDAQSLDSLALEQVKALSIFVSESRRPILHDRYKGSWEVLEAEGPGRLVKILVQVYRAAQACYAGNQNSALRLTMRIAVDSIPGHRGRILRELVRSPLGLTAGRVAGILSCDDNTARTELQNLVAMKLATADRPANTDVYRASETLRRHAAAVFPEEDPGQAARKLFDSGKSSTPEGEREKKETGEEG